MSLFSYQEPWTIAMRCGGGEAASSIAPAILMVRGHHRRFLRIPRTSGSRFCFVIRQSHSWLYSPPQLLELNDKLAPGGKKYRGKMTSDALAVHG